MSELYSYSTQSELNSNKHNKVHCNIIINVILVWQATS